MNIITPTIKAIDQTDDVFERFEMLIDIIIKDSYTNMYDKKLREKRTN